MKTGMRQLFRDQAWKGSHPDSYGAIGREDRAAIEHAIITAYPELGYADSTWKAAQLGQTVFPTWEPEAKLTPVKREPEPADAKPSSAAVPTSDKRKRGPRSPAPTGNKRKRESSPPAPPRARSSGDMGLVPLVRERARPATPHPPLPHNAPSDPHNTTITFHHAFTSSVGPLHAHSVFCATSSVGSDPA